LHIPADQWQILSPLLDVALPLSATARRDWLARQTQLSEATHAQLAKLIALADAPESDHIFQSLTLLGGATSRIVPPSVRHAGQQVGAYELMRPLGRGGMAEVWLARRDDGAYEREVALKLPLAHLPQNVASERLQREKNVLAALEHPAIARFYDAGVAGDGQPFLAMEYVQGETITDYANRLRLNLRARCRLMLAVLDALHYAHQHLVVHRDLKPTNILVRDDGRVTLLDFGIAKVLEAPGAATEATELTQAMGSALTLAYAAPEQLLAQPVTTATDIYSAGVLMFELLAGARPFAATEGSALALLQAIETTAVPTRITVGLGQGEGNAEAHGAASGDAWQRAFQGDLAAICARALRREPAERYGSALAMTDDVTRYLEDRPVQARAGAWAYRWRKFFARNRVALTVSTMTSLVALGFGVQAWQKTQASRISAARVTAVESVVKSLFDGMNPNSNTPRNFTAKELLDRSRPLLLLAAAGNAESKRQTTLMMAKLYLDIGALDDAARLLQEEITDARSEGDLPRELWAQCLMADVELDQDRNQAAFDRMTDAKKRWAAASTAPRMLTADIGYRLGTAALFTQKRDLATQHLSEAIALLKTLPDTTGDAATELTANVLIKLGGLARDRSDVTAATGFFIEAQTRLQPRIGMQQTKDVLAIEMLPLLMTTGRYDEAIVQAEALLRHLSTRNDSHQPYPAAVAGHYTTALARTGRLTEARQQADRLLANAPDPTGSTATQARFMQAQIALLGGDGAAAEPVFRAQLAASLNNPTANPRARQWLRRALAHCLLKLSRNDEATALLRDIESTQITLIAEENSPDIALTRLLLGVALLRQGDINTAQATLVRARDTLLLMRGASHYGCLLAEAYLALIEIQINRQGAPSVNAATLAGRVQRQLGWQHGATELVARLQATTPRPIQSVPVVF
jgi:serine/threonine protein kinase